MRNRHGNARIAGTAPNANATLHVAFGVKPMERQNNTTTTESNAPTPCMAKTAAINVPLRPAEDDSDVTVAANGYSPPTPIY